MQFGGPKTSSSAFLFVIVQMFRHGIITLSTPRVAARNPAHGKKASTPSPMFFNRLHRIV
jgi:hypothetical protein